MLTTKEVFGRMKSIKALVIGDFALDVYTKGKVDRISPEAPVPVLLVSEITEAPGMAGNVALNLRALGADVEAIGRIGSDVAGRKLQSALFSKGVNTKGLFMQDGYATPLKNRFLAAGQQIMRSDYEMPSDFLLALEDEVIAYVQESISKVDIIAVSDYGKGFLTKNILTAISDAARKNRLKVIVDPKGNDFSKYDGFYLIKPNNKEAYGAAFLGQEESIQEVAKTIFSKVNTEFLLVTRSDKGMILFSKDDVAGKEFLAVKKEVRDVTGAGDTALAMITFALGNKMPFDEAIELANIASGIAIEQVGCKAVKLVDILQRLLEREPLNKIFGEDSNLFVLEKALENSPLILLDFQHEQEISTEIYHKIMDAAFEKNEAKILVHIIPTSKNKNFIHLLSSMQEIDFIFARSDKPARLFRGCSVLTTI